LRYEQNFEFERAAEADRERALQQQAEQKAREEEAEQAQSQAELNAALELSKALDKEATLKRLRESLVPEPPSGPDTTKIRLQLPNGSKIDRRFPSTSTIGAVRNFVDVYLSENGLEHIEHYSVGTNFPKQIFSDDSISLREAGLHPQSVLYVQDLDA
jgi:ATPase subunit of ABC transporter with duplicated ATPase domains